MTGTNQPSPNPYAVSVIIPVYNVGQYINRALDSVLGQRRVPEEIILIDDGSTDDTLERIEAYGSRLRLLRQGHRGVSAARNAGIRAARGPWIAFLDADDLWLPENLARQMVLLERNPQLVWTCANYTFVQGERRFHRLDPDLARRRLAGRDLFDDFLRTGSLGSLGHLDTMIIRKDALEAVGMFDEDLPMIVDHDLWWKIAYRWPQIGFTPEPMAQYFIQRAGSLTTGKTWRDKTTIFERLIAVHLDMSRQFDRDAAFRDRLAYMLQWWLRNLQKEKANDIIRRWLRDYGDLLPAGFRRRAFLRARFPRLASFALFFFNGLYNWRHRQDSPQTPEIEIDVANTKTKKAP